MIVDNIVQARSYIEQTGKVMDDGRQHTLSLETYSLITMDTLLPKYLSNFNPKILKFFPMPP